VLILVGKKSGKGKKRLPLWKRAAFAFATPLILLGIAEGPFASWA
jgi:hypothetical protein